MTYLRDKCKPIVFDAWRGECAYCGAPATDMDHVIPVSRGGADSLWNFVPSCKSCNSMKWNHLLSEWEERLDRKIAALRSEVARLERRKEGIRSVKDREYSEVSA